MDILVLNDGIKGNFNQSYGIARAFPSANIKISDIKLKGPYYRLPRRKGSYPVLSKILALICSMHAWPLGKKVLSVSLCPGAKLPDKKPDIIISAGSVLSPVNLILAKSRKNTKSVHIMVPAMVSLKLFDFLVVPYHDYLKTKRRRPCNLIVTLGAPNLITETFLRQEAEKAGKTITIKNKNILTLGVIIGGDDQNYKISLAYIKNLLNFIGVSEKRYNFLFSTSRRTDKKVVRYLQQFFAKEGAVVYAEFPGYSNISHYPGILGLCDCLLVTEDSINMISETASSGVPVIIIGVEKTSRKKIIFDYTLEKFVEKGYAEYVPKEKFNLLHAKIALTKNAFPKKLNESEQCAQKILKNMA